jgi:hypothetical protein
MLHAIVIAVKRRIDQSVNQNHCNRARQDQHYMSTLIRPGSQKLNSMIDVILHVQPQNYRRTSV